MLCPNSDTVGRYSVDVHQPILTIYARNVPDNISAQNYQHRLTYVQVIASDISVVFWGSQCSAHSLIRMIAHYISLSYTSYTLGCLFTMCSTPIMNYTMKTSLVVVATREFLLANLDFTVKQVNFWYRHFDVAGCTELHIRSTNGKVRIIGFTSALHFPHFVSESDIISGKMACVRIVANSWKYCMNGVRLLYNVAPKATAYSNMKTGGYKCHTPSRSFSAFTFSRPVRFVLVTFSEITENNLIN